MMDKVSTQAAVVNYRSPAALMYRGLAVAATACFMVFFPLPIFYLFLVGMKHGIAEALLFSASTLSLLLFLLAFQAYRLNRVRRLIFTDGGICLPGGKTYGRRSKDLIPWSQIAKIEVVKDSSGDSSASLVLSPERRGAIRLQLSALSFEDLDKVVSACQLWANRWALESTFTDLVNEVTGQRSGTDDSSFTALWLQEAHRRLATTPFKPLEPGTTLQDKRVKVVMPLTAGGWSAIYLCQWREKTPAVLKEAVVPAAVKDHVRQKAYEHFEREAVLLSGLNHKQIAKVLDYFVEAGRQYMVLERIAGANLRSYIKDRGPVSQRQALKWAAELVEIIGYLHGQNPPIVHRDLTPENLVLDMKGSLVLIDFGSANEFLGTVTGTLVGKPSYISPEQFSGRANLQSDLYSLGAVVYFMLSGKDPEPLSAASPKADNAQVSDRLNELVADLMQIDLKKRLPNIEAVKSRLDTMVASG